MDYVQKTPKNVPFERQKIGISLLLEELEAKLVDTWSTFEVPLKTSVYSGSYEVLRYVGVEGHHN